MTARNADVALTKLYLVDESETFEETYSHPDADHKSECQEAMSKEFKGIAAKCVWGKIQ